MTSSFKLRPFDGTAVTFTMREIHAPAREFKSQYHDAEEAAGAFLDACATASSVELRDPEEDHCRLCGTPPGRLGRPPPPKKIAAQRARTRPRVPGFCRCNSAPFYQGERP